jgi:hypothetical protein
MIHKMNQNETSLNHCLNIKSTRVFKRFFKCTLALSWFLIFGSCGQKSTNSEGISMSLQPKQSYLLPGASSNCLDVSAYKKTILSSATNIPTQGTSVSSFRVSFPKFGLGWTQNTTLFVAYLRLTITSSSLSGGKFEYDVAGAELSALLGTSSNSFKGKSTLMNSEDPVKTGQIYSDDPARDCSGATNVLTGQTCTPTPTIFTKFYGACGLDIGGIALSDKAPSQFTAPFILKLVGYSVDDQGNQLPIFSQINGTVIYAGSN